MFSMIEPDEKEDFGNEEWLDQFGAVDAVAPPPAAPEPVDLLEKLRWSRRRHKLEELEAEIEEQGGEHCAEDRLLRDRADCLATLARVPGRRLCVRGQCPPECARADCQAARSSRFPRQP